MRLVSRLMRSLAVVALVAGGVVHAATVTLSQFPPNPGLMPGGTGWQWTQGSNWADPPPQRAWVNGVYGGVPKFLATDALVIAGPAGALPVSVISAVGMRDAALAVARCALGANLICGAGTAAYAAYKAYRAYKAGESAPDGVAAPSPLDPSTWGSVFEFDPGQAPVTGKGYDWYYGDQSPPFASHSGTEVNATAAGQQQLSAFDADNTKVSGNVKYEQKSTLGVCTEVGSQWQCSAKYTRTQTVVKDCTANCFTSSGPFDYYPGRSINLSAKTCPASIDAFNPSYSIPAGGPVGPDGLCPTARYSHKPITPEDLASKVEAKPPQLPDATWLQALRDSIQPGGQTVPSTVTSSGPASQTGTPTTTTETTGSPPVTKTTTSTPTYNYTYAGDKITYNVTNNTTTNNNGAVTTTVTTNAAPPLDSKTDCDKYPDSLGCAKLGQVPDAEKIPTQDAPATYSPVPFGSAGGCPAPFPLDFSVSGRSFSYSISNTPLCDLMVTLNPIFLALFAASAAFVFYDGIGKATG